MPHPVASTYSRLDTQATGFPYRPSGSFATAKAPDEATFSSEILVVGEEPTRGVAHQLRTAGFAVSFARTAEAAERFMRERVPIAVLLGASPGTDPYRAVRRLRNDERLAFVPVFAIVPFRKGVRMCDAIAAGADDVFDAL